MKYTPGPWKVSPMNWDMVYPEDGKTPICLIGGMYYKATKQANARLIAAAPTMYEYIRKKSEEGCEQAQEIMQLLS